MIKLKKYAVIILNKQETITEGPKDHDRKHIVLNTDEIEFIKDRLQWNINFAPEENTQKEIDLTKSIFQKIIM